MIRVKVIVRVTDYSQGKLMVIISVMVKLRLGLGLEFYPNNLVTITLTPKLTLAIYTTK